jgi:cation diffusion facilitator family transporter
MVTTRAQSLLSLTSLFASGLLVGGLFYVYLLFGSQLALAQAADSLLDVFTAGVLAFAIRVASLPRDENHPFGHSRAEPVGALITAVIAGVLAIEVARSAIGALVLGNVPDLEWPLAALFGGKLAFKGAISLIGWRMLKNGAGPGIAALTVDARNDVMINSLALAGYFGARAGFPQLDAWLALPTVLWIGYSGWRLATDNIRLLMGEAPPAKRQDELATLARQCAGVKDVPGLRAQHMGTQLQVHVEIVVDEALTIKQSHDIGEAVRERLEAEPDVGHATVHIDIA